MTKSLSEKSVYEIIDEINTIQGKINMVRGVHNNVDHQPMIAQMENMIMERERELYDREEIANAPKSGVIATFGEETNEKE